MRRSNRDRNVSVDTEALYDRYRSKPAPSKKKKETGVDVVEVEDIDDNDDTDAKSIAKKKLSSSSSSSSSAAAATGTAATGTTAASNKRKKEDTKTPSKKRVKTETETVTATSKKKKKKNGCDTCQFVEELEWTPLSDIEDVEWDPVLITDFIVTYWKECGQHGDCLFYVIARALLAFLVEDPTLGTQHPGLAALVAYLAAHPKTKSAPADFLRQRLVSVLKGETFRAAHPSASADAVKQKSEENWFAFLTPYQRENTPANNILRRSNVARDTLEKFLLSSKYEGDEQTVRMLLQDQSLFRGMGVVSVIPVDNKDTGFTEMVAYRFMSDDDYLNNQYLRVDSIPKPRVQKVTRYMVLMNAFPVRRHWQLLGTSTQGGVNPPVSVWHSFNGFPNWLQALLRQPKCLSIKRSGFWNNVVYTSEDEKKKNDYLYALNLELTDTLCEITAQSLYPPTLLLPPPPSSSSSSSATATAALVGVDQKIDPMVMLLAEILRPYFIGNTLVSQRAALRQKMSKLFPGSDGRDMPWVRAMYFHSHIPYAQQVTENRSLLYDSPDRRANLAQGSSVNDPLFLDAVLQPDDSVARLFTLQQALLWTRSYDEKMQPLYLNLAQHNTNVQRIMSDFLPTRVSFADTMVSTMEDWQTLLYGGGVFNETNPIPAQTLLTYDGFLNVVRKYPQGVRPSLYNEEKHTAVIQLVLARPGLNPASVRNVTNVADLWANKAQHRDTIEQLHRMFRDDSDSPIQLNPEMNVEKVAYERIRSAVADILMSQMQNLTNLSMTERLSYVLQRYAYAYRFKFSRRNRLLLLLLPLPPLPPSSSSSSSAAAFAAASTTTKTSGPYQIPSFYPQSEDVGTLYRINLASLIYIPSDGVARLIQAPNMEQMPYEEQTFAALMETVDGQWFTVYRRQFDAERSRRKYYRDLFFNALTLPMRWQQDILPLAQRKAYIAAKYLSDQRVNQ